MRQSDHANLSVPKKSRPILMEVLESNLLLTVFSCLMVFFLLAHTLNLSSKYTSLYLVIEFLSIFMSFSIALVLWYTYEYSRGFLQVLGSSFLTIGLLKLFHALSFPGMPQFITGSAEEKTLLFWVGSRLLEAGALLAGGLITAKNYQINLDRRITFGAASAISGVALLAVSFYGHFFKQTFYMVNQVFFSAFVAALLVLAIFLYRCGSKKPGNENYKFLLSGIIAGIFAEAALAFHAGAGGAFNLLGHIYKLVSYAFIFHVLFGQTVRRPFKDIEKLLDQTISSISRALDGRDRYTHSHSVRVAGYACAMAQVLGVDKDLKKSLRLSGLLHDIGKIAVPDSVLNKDGPLTGVERELIKMHPVKGAEILEPIEQLQLLRGIAEHHERMDGKGYPIGKAGEEISLEARILAVADTFDAITSNRVYRPKKSKKEAMDILVKASGTQLDTRVVQAFIQADREGLVDPIMEK